ncbi:STAS domain-containing protein [Pseudalkalibacillus salsuginis]|uniref:STAS domain-containing protein n=1 Tax=Pseudalkalibacillus salsuginis TaxID=2910972 RepID=UPI001F48B77A|nr:STAS domain-containing protein [Pseudalkalibacillus salsuginis]MCF6411806.1 STAS domain-containing protein [Pseudalkalibacillus salsuginis]
MNLQIQKKDTDDHIDELVLIGEVDAYTAPKLKETLLEAAQKQGQKIIVNLSGVQYMDSTGLGVFVGALKSSQQSGSTLTLTGMTERVERLFEITGLTEVINIENTQEEEAR